MGHFTPTYRYEWGEDPRYEWGIGTVMNGGFSRRPTVMNGGFGGENAVMNGGKYRCEWGKTAQKSRPARKKGPPLMMIISIFKKIKTKTKNNNQGFLRAGRNPTAPGLLRT